MDSNEWKLLWLRLTSSAHPLPIRRLIRLASTFYSDRSDPMAGSKKASAALVETRVLLDLKSEFSEEVAYAYWLYNHLGWRLHAKGWIDGLNTYAIFLTDGPQVSSGVALSKVGEDEPAVVYQKGEHSRGLAKELADALLVEYSPKERVHKIVFWLAFATESGGK